MGTKRAKSDHGNDLLAGAVIGRGKSREGPPPLELQAILTPSPPLIASIPDLKQHLRGAWFWSLRHIAKMKMSNSAREQFVVTMADLEVAESVFADKQIAPAAWMAWRVSKMINPPLLKPPTLRGVLAVKWLQEGPKRGWFRSETAGLFGGELLHTRSQLDLIDLYSLAKRRFMNGDTWPEAVRKTFKGESLAALIRRVEAEAVDMRQKYADRARRGYLFPIRRDVFKKG